MNNNEKTCDTCRYGWDTGGCPKSMFGPSDICWRPMTEAQMLEKMMADRPSDGKKVLVGSIDSGYSFVTPEAANAQETYKKHSGDIVDALLYSVPKLIMNIGKEDDNMYIPKISRQRALERIKKVIFNDPYTIVIWNDGTKTKVKAEGEPFDKEKGLAMAISKYFFDNRGYYYDVFKKWISDEAVGVKEVKKPKTQTAVKSTYSDITLKEYCAIRNITKNKAYGMIKRGELIAYKNENGLWMIPYFKTDERSENND